ncbi:MAG: M23 family metallopeptidase [Xanthomonadales bacterium]|nr:M23 family metallopeptidase [Xanthomonadales bacterium]
MRRFALPHGLPIARQTLALLALLLTWGPAKALELQGEPVQGGLIFGATAPGSTVTLDGRKLLVSGEGRFLFGFGRDDTGSVTLEVQPPDTDPVTREITIAPREYNIERVDGLPPATVTPPPEVIERTRREAALVAQARTRRDNRTDWAAGFTWPAQGRLSGFYGSQRVLNGEPRRPHYGVDVAAPTGTPVLAPAPGIVTLAEPDLYFSGGTLIIDHGQGLSSTFLHLSAVSVAVGDTVNTGDKIGEIGATGRATGPHLDWRMNWYDKRVDPQPLAGDMPVE